MTPKVRTLVRKFAPIIIIAVIVVGGGYYAYRQLLPAGDDDSSAPVYATEPVTRGDIAVFVEASGPLNPSSGGGIQAPLSMASGGPASYTVLETYVKEGDAVTTGQPLVKLDPASTKDLIRAREEKLNTDKRSLADLMGVSVDDLGNVDPSRGITLRAPIGGRVIGLNVEEGKELRRGEIVARVVDDTRFKATVKLVPAEYSQISLGDRIVLRFPDYDGFAEGVVTELNPSPVLEDTSKLPDSIGGTGSKATGYQFVYWVTVEGTNPGLVAPGMMAQAGRVMGVPASTPLDQIAEKGGIVAFFRYYAQIDGYADEEQILSGADAIATKVYAHEMQMVKPGDPLVSLAGEDAQKVVSDLLDQVRQEESDLAMLYQQLDGLVVKASMDGIVGYIEARPGMVVQPGQWFGNIFNTADMAMWVQVDDVDVLLVRQGAPVSVTVDAVPGQTFEGIVENVGMMGKDQNGITQFQVSIRVKGGPELRPGMQAKAHIDVGSAQGVLLVPLEAIFEEDGKPKVEILLDNGQTKVVAVELGLMNDMFAEVKSGLAEGQLVITGSTADLLPSQRIQSDSLIPGGSSGGSGGGNGGGSGGGSGGSGGGGNSGGSGTGPK